MFVIIRFQTTVFSSAHWLKNCRAAGASFKMGSVRAGEVVSPLQLNNHNM
jgi:hypothetical protein